MKTTKELNIIALTIKGEKAIKKHISECTKMSWKDKLIFKTAGYKQQLINTKPITLLLTINNMHSNNPMFLDLIQQQIFTALKKNKAVKGIDYKIIMLNKEV